MPTTQPNVIDSASEMADLTRRVDDLTVAVKKLTLRNRRLQSSISVSSGNTLFISTFAPEPYRVHQLIPVNVRREHQGFTATSFDTNVSASGETEKEAFSGLKSLLIDLFELLAAKPEASLGPEPARQLATMKDLFSRV